MISPSFKSIPPNCLIDTQYIEQIEFLGEEGWQWPILKNYLNEDSICYCAGAGDDISFETALFQCYRSNIFIIDPLVNLDNNGKKHTLSKTKDALEIIGNPDKVKLIDAEFKNPKTSNEAKLYFESEDFTSLCKRNELVADVIVYAVRELNDYPVLSKKKLAEDICSLIDKFFRGFSLEFRKL